MVIWVVCVCVSNQAVTPYEGFSVRFPSYNEPGSPRRAAAVTHSVTYTCEAASFPAMLHHARHRDSLGLSPLMVTSLRKATAGTSADADWLHQCVTVRVRESAASLIFCQADLAAKREGVRSHAASRHPSSQPLCLSACVLFSTRLSVYVDGFNVALLVPYPPTLCSCKVLWMKSGNGLPLISRSV